MGCDIHAYLEHREREDWPWQSFGGRINPGRDYEVFGRLAGVRSGETPVIRPRGIPDDLAYWAQGDWWLHISDDYADSPGFCSSKSAEGWSKSYGLRVEERNGKPCRIEHPDWHTPGWVHPEEFERALSAANRCQHDPGYYALLAAMKEFERRGHEVRLVFWFDN